MNFVKIIITPGPECLPDEEDFVCGIKKANEEYESQKKSDALLFTGFDCDGYAMIIGKYEDELDLDTFLTETIIPYENYINYVELSLDEVKKIVESKQKKFYYFSRSAAKRLLGEEFIADESGYDYDLELEEYTDEYEY